MKNLPLLIGTLVVMTALIFGVVSFFSKGGQSHAISQEVLLSDNPHVRGNVDAPVTIVEFSDFQCPACAYTRTLIEKVLADYPDKVRLVYRNFPLSSIHHNAQLAAQAAEVAGEKGLFWEYHDVLFTNQEKWSQLEGKKLLLDQLASYAEEVGIDKESFLERIDSDYIKSLVNEDVVLGNQLKLRGTPTLYVNGQPTPASQLIKQVESIN